MIWWHHLVEIKRIKELALSTLLPPHHRPLPRIATSIRRNHGSSIVSMRVLQLLQHNPPESRHPSPPPLCQLWANSGSRACMSVWIALFSHGTLRRGGVRPCCPSSRLSSLSLPLSSSRLSELMQLIPA